MLAGANLAHLQTAQADSKTKVCKRAKSSNPQTNCDMNDIVFISDRPINTSKEDKLNRLGFAYQLKESLSKWEGEDSLVISLKGEWGLGKSSVISLIKEQMELDKKENNPTLIEFNPWIFSNKDNLNFHFFNEIANELKLRKEKVSDELIAKKLKLYSELIELKSDSNLSKDFVSKLIIGLGLFGISVSQIIQWIGISDRLLSTIIFIFGILLIGSQLISQTLSRIAKVFEIKALKKDTSVLSLKKEIINHLKDRKKKLLIIIDDIDRLTQNEIRDIFRLIRINADFPNTIYLLAYDSRIIELNLEEQAGISGKEYLKKIVQVDFDLPYVKIDNIRKNLFAELEQLILKLPSSVNKYFEGNYWANTYHAGYKDFFQNIRDVKRYVNSLLFNINFLYKENVFEVNPVDFFAIEVLRVFVPEFHVFMKARKELFVNQLNMSGGLRDAEKKSRKENLENGFNLVTDSHKESVKKLIANLFPQIKNIISENNFYSSDYQTKWGKEQRVCSAKHFDAYFTLIPGSNEAELTQYEVDKFIASTENFEELEQNIDEYLGNKKIRAIVERLDDYIGDKSIFNKNKTKNLIKVFFNRLDNFPTEREGMFDFGIDFLIMRIIYQLIKDEDKEENYLLLNECISKSNGIYGPVDFISLETQHQEKNSNINLPILSVDRLKELQILCVTKIENCFEQNPRELLNNNNFLFIFYRWKEWNNTNLDTLIKKVNSDDELLILFCKSFISETRSYAFGSNNEEVHKFIHFKRLNEFIPVEPIIDKFKSYNANDTFIKFFLTEYENYKSNPDGYSRFD